MKSLWLELAELPGNLSHHLQITMLALLLGMLISFPLAILAVRVPKVRYPILAIVSIVQTIPSLALLALMVPTLVGINLLIFPLLGSKLKELGFIPTIVALTLYSLLPMLRNAVTGLLNVDTAAKEAARGVGMTPAQSLWKVELPLALPVIVAGLRTAAVWTVGIATLATPVGQKCLGDYFFRGLNTRNWTAVMVGCVAAAGLAILLDSLIGALQTAIEQRRRKTIKWTCSAVGTLLVLGLSAPALVHALRPAPQAVASSSEEESQTGNKGPETIVVGSKAFTEQYILAELMTERLEEAGLTVVQKKSLGSTIIFDALMSGEIDVYVDYTGTIWANHMKRTEIKKPWKIMAEMSAWLAEEYDARALGTLGFENAYALAIRRSDARQLGIETIDDLAKHAPELSIGGDYEIFGRTEWFALKDAYGLSFREKTSYDSTLMYEAIRQEGVDAIMAFSTDGRIAAYELQVLDDPREAIPPYDAVVLLSPDVADNDAVVNALRPLLNQIDGHLMRRANLRVDQDVDKKTVKETAEWLWREILEQQARFAASKPSHDD